MEKIKTDVQKTQKSSDTDGFIDKYFLEPAGMLFAHLFIKIRFTPNMISVTSAVAGLVGSAMLIVNNIRYDVYGMIFIILSLVFDTSDGQVARLTHRTSEFGRILDGICDAVVGACIYVGLSIRLMPQTIPFTNISWGWRIWIVTLFAGVWSYRTQGSMSDYFRMLHLFFLKGYSIDKFDRSYKVKQKLENKKGIEGASLSFYYNYTKEQELFTPCTQKLLNNLEIVESIPESLRNDFLIGSRKSVKLTALISYNFRTVVLFTLLFLKIESFYFAFVIIVLGAMKLIMIKRYEKLASELNKKYFTEA